MTEGGYIARKCFVSVVAEFKARGGIDPLAIVWEDGRRFEVDRIVDRAYLSDQESGGRGLRYTVRILGREKFLWQDDEGHWYVNRHVGEEGDGACAG